MPQMTYAGDGPRTVRRGPRLYELQPGDTFDADPADVDYLRGVGADDADLSDLTVDVLRDRAAAAGIDGYTSMKKAELVTALEEA